MSYIVPDDVVGVGGDGRLDVVSVFGGKVTVDDVQQIPISLVLSELCQYTRREVFSIGYLCKALISAG